MQAKFLFNPRNQYKSYSKWGMPFIKACNPNILGKTWTPFSYCRSRPAERPNKVCHFFIHDHLFERVWNTRSTLQWVYGYAAATTPDFSTYTDMPIAYQMWNRFRSMYIGAYMQNTMNLSVIPCLAWSTEAPFEFCFDGIDKGGAVALNSTGIEKDQVEDFHLAGLNEVLKRIEPAIIYVYGGKKDWYPDWHYVDIPTFCNRIEDRVVRRKEKETNAITNQTDK